MPIKKSEQKQREQFTADVLNQVIVGITIEAGTLAFVLSNGKSVLIWEDEGDLQAWCGDPNEVD